MCIYIYMRIIKLTVTKGKFLLPSYDSLSPFEGCSEIPRERERKQNKGVWDLSTTSVYSMCCKYM